MNDKNTGRRTFLQAAGIASAFTILKPHLLRGSAANSAVRVGLLGCGRRGSTDATNIAQNTDARVVALGDMFQDQIDKARQRFDKLAESKGYSGVSQTFVGPKAFEAIMESKEVDAVVIATPAYFHPEHSAAAVAAGNTFISRNPWPWTWLGPSASSKPARRRRGGSASMLVFKSGWRRPSSSW